MPTCAHYEACNDFLQELLSLASAAKRPRPGPASASSSGSSSESGSDDEVKLINQQHSAATGMGLL